MYHVTTDNQFPYHVYGSQQESRHGGDSESRPLRTDRRARVVFRRRRGERLHRGGSEESQYLYVNNTNGSLARFDKRTGQSQNITPSLVRSGGLAGHLATQKYRFPWTSPLVFSPVEQGTLYYGAQVLLKTVDGGLNWQEISGDLTGDTRKDKSPPTSRSRPTTRANSATASSIRSRPLRLSAGLIWTGSDTGLIHLTRDGGKTWSNVTPPGLAAWSKVTQIEASHFEPGTAWAAVDRHRREDYRP